MALNVSTFSETKRPLHVDIPTEGRKVETVILDFYPDRSTMQDFDDIEASEKAGELTTTEAMWEQLILWVDGWDLEVGEGEPLEFTYENFANLSTGISIPLLIKVVEQMEKRMSAVGEGKASRGGLSRRK